MSVTMFLIIEALRVRNVPFQLWKLCSELCSEQCSELCSEQCSELCSEQTGTQTMF